ncbi:MAG: carboxypeptidase-like regulatory domain-containing protein, partial [Gemmatimonadetes bacterium]|nr:carboxypeptidase-like regulatory domain-containing protein [Gemmatimonadota bacterium]
MSPFVSCSTPRRVWTAGLLCLVTALLAATPAAAQRVRGRLVDAGTGEPVPAAEMSLLSGESGTRVVKRALTTDSGRFVLTAPRPGRYRLKAERIGYRTVVSPPFDLV